MALPKEILIEVSEGGTITLPELIPQHAIDASQAWFWLDCWQAMEREADAAIAARRVRRFNSGDDLLAELEHSEAPFLT